MATISATRFLDDAQGAFALTGWAALDASPAENVYKKQGGAWLLLRNTSADTDATVTIGAAAELIRATDSGVIGQTGGVQVTLEKGGYAYAFNVDAVSGDVKITTSSTTVQALAFVFVR
jgi:hypothetical protein